MLTPRMFVAPSALVPSILEAVSIVKPDTVIYLRRRSSWRISGVRCSALHCPVRGPRTGNVPTRNAFPDR